MFFATLATLAAAVWVYLLAARGGFWRCGERDTVVPPPPARWPNVAAIVPARNEAETIATSIGSLLAQDYPGALAVVLVDDDSEDGTAALARDAAKYNSRRPLAIVESRGVAPGWTGKLWALKQGIDAARALPQPPDYLLLTDADIAHMPDSVRLLVARAEGGGYSLTSLMAKLRCETLAERSHVPAFVYFFQMLFPFAWVNTPERATAAAAGGCMLVKADALAQAGGIERIRSALIDDCSLARVMKSVGPIWLGLTERVHSLRRYSTLDDVRAMISRSAYAQLNYSPALLVATVLGLALTFLAAPLLALFGSGLVQILGVMGWALMVLSFVPMLRFYGCSPLWGLALPAIAFAYMLYTLDSAIRYARGQGGHWKGRVQAKATPSATP
jgi:hopene-associated glycosyltransferase HpnB